MTVETLIAIAGGWKSFRDGHVESLGGGRGTAWGTYRPVVGSTAGTLPGSTFTQHTGDLVASAAGTYENLEIFGRFVVGAAGVTLSNSIVHGPASGLTAGDFCVKSNSFDLMGATITDCLIDGGSSSVWLNGIGGNNFTIQRSEITGVVDGIDFTSAVSNTNVWGNVVHNDAYFTWTPPGGDGHSDGQTHNDAVQFSRGKQISIIGNDFTGYHNSGIMLQQEVSSLQADMIENVTIDSNWFGWANNGPASGINTAVKFSNTLASCAITNNKFDRMPGGYSSYYLIKASQFAGTMSGNVFSDDGSPVTITNGA